MSDTPKENPHRGYHAELLDACAEYRAKVNDLEHENAALRAEVKITRQNYEEYKRENIALREKFMLAESEIMLLREEREELRKDKERLDWLGSQKDQPWLYWERPLRLTREAIDAYRKDTPP